MATSNMEFPLKIKRQYAEPLDADTYAETIAELDDIKTRANSYVGMMVSCREDGLVYVLGTDMEFTALGTKVNRTDIVDNLTSTDTNKPLSANQGKVLKDEVDLKANDNEVIKKTDIKTTLDENSTNDDVCGGKAIFDAIQANVIGKETVLYDGNITATGTYTLTDNVNNYDLIIIHHSSGSGNFKQSTILTKNEISKCIDGNNQFLCVHGNGTATYYATGYFNGDKIISTSTQTEYITSIVGYKFGQITVQNTITNPLQPISYSTDEQLTGGTWVDGKPIYRKTVECGVLPNKTSKSVAHGITNIGVVIASYGTAFNPSTNSSQQLPFVSSASANCIVFYYNETSIIIETGMDRTSFKKSYITFEYTKKTD